MPSNAKSNYLRRKASKERRGYPLNPPQHQQHESPKPSYPQPKPEPKP